MSTTPAIRVAGSNVANPCTVAAIDRAAPAAVTTSTTGARSSRATCAVLARSPRPVTPSNRPMTPSITLMSADPAPTALAPCRNSGAIKSSPVSHGSRLRPGRPVAAAW